MNDPPDPIEPPASPESEPDPQAASRNVPEAVPAVAPAADGDTAEPAVLHGPGRSLDGQASRRPPERWRGFRGMLEMVGLVPPKRGRDPYAHRRGEPRGFAALWMFYLLIASAVVYATVGTPTFGSETGFRYASKILMTVIAVGVVIVWPMVRLSQRAPERAARSVLRDLLVVLLPVQAFYWPQLLLTEWGVDAVGGSMLLLVAWALVVGSVLILAAQTVATESAAYGEPDRGERVTVRVLWMLVILVMPLVGPWLWRSAGTGWAGLGSSGPSGSSDLLALTSPLTGHWELLRNRVWTGSRTVVAPEHWRVVVLSLVVGVSAWVVVLVGLRPRVRASGRGSA